MTSLSSFLPQNTIMRPCVAKMSSSSRIIIPFPVHGRSQIFFAGSNRSARLVHAKLQVARAAAICIAQVEETSQDAPSESLNGAGLQLDRPAPPESVRQDATADASVSTAHAAENSDDASEGTEERSSRRESNRGRGQGNRGRGNRGGRGTGGNYRRDSRGPRFEDPRRSPCTEHSLKVGGVVLGRVIRSQGKGSNVELLDDPRIVGFSLAADGPYLMRDRVGYNQSNMLLPVGLVRPFTIKAIPEDMEYYGKGPLLSAKEIDIEVAWQRAHQMKHACDEDKEVFTVVVTDVNTGGLLATLESLPAFLPYSLMAKSKEDSWMAIEDVKAKFEGKSIEVGIKDVSPHMRKVVLNMQQAATNKLLRKLRVGSLVWGMVRRVEPYGVFVGLEDTRFSGLLHISCISRAHVEAVEDLFSVGDRVRSMLVGMDEGFSRISLSTSELEATPGDMLYAKDKVYAEAEVHAAEALKKMQQRDEDDRFYGEDRQARQGGSSFDFDGGYKG